MFTNYSDSNATFSLVKQGLKELTQTQQSLAKEK